jgi:GH15 family glucan-1,4-alpha-glucosidase
VKVPLRIQEGAAVAEFTLRCGQTAAFILEDGQNRRRARSADPHYVTEAFKETLNFWRQWVRRSRYRGRWREMVNRSALTLKAADLGTTRLHSCCADLWTA